MQAPAYWTAAMVPNGLVYPTVFDMRKDSEFADRIRLLMCNEEDNNLLYIQDTKTPASELFRRDIVCNGSFVPKRLAGIAAVLYQGFILSENTGDYSRFRPDLPEVLVQIPDEAKTHKGPIGLLIQGPTDERTLNTQYNRTGPHGKYCQVARVTVYALK